MFRGHNRGRGRGRGRGSLEKVPLKGLFSDGTWHCNCEPRLPAEHFQTKNGGKNHGRWCEFPLTYGYSSNILVYTCQKPQPRRCNFFLWDDEAKPREAAAVLKNSRSEPITPSKDRSRTGSPDIITRYTPSKAPASTQTTSTLEEVFDWPNSDDDELFRVTDRASMAPPETPRKAIKTDMVASPSKRRHDEMESGLATPASDDVFTTPATGLHDKNLFSAGLISPAETPTHGRFKEIPLGGDSELATEVLAALSSIAVDAETRDAVKTVCNKNALRTQGIAKGRDISRLAIKAKDGKIAALQARIAALEAERETNRAVIRHLRRDIEMSRSQPK